ncbi:hypothetical protein ACFRFU_54505, partial [Streptomyces sp. NPDC056704]|uniref:hypothetical protein n=1 Tax=Streptomyces sp. NPDC056704 TaxID=3345917 RepID=UPI003675F1CA
PLRGQLARRVRRAGTGKPAPETVQGVPSPTQHLDLDKAGAKLLFQIFTEGEERRAIEIASNAPFSKAHLFRRTRARCCRNFTSSMVSRRLPSRFDVRATRS